MSHIAEGGLLPDEDPYTTNNVGPQAPTAVAVSANEPTESASEILGAQAVTTATSLAPGSFLGLDPYKGHLRKQHIDELKDKVQKRSVMMQWAIWLCSGIVAFSTIAMGFYMASEWNELSAAVMVGWFGSVVAQVIGIVFVVANYLFPKDDHAMEATIQHLDGNGSNPSPPAT